MKAEYMSQDIRPVNAVLESVEDGTLQQKQAKEILPFSQPTIHNYLGEQKYSENRTKKVNLNRNAVLTFVEKGVLTQKQAGEILGVTASAVAQALD